MSTSRHWQGVALLLLLLGAACASREAPQSDEVAEPPSDRAIVTLRNESAERVSVWVREGPQRTSRLGSVAPGGTEEFDIPQAWFGAADEVQLHVNAEFVGCAEPAPLIAARVSRVALVARRPDAPAPAKGDSNPPCVLSLL